MWFSIWSSLIVITDEGRNPETGWLRSYLVCIYIYFFSRNFWILKIVIIPATPFSLRFVLFLFTLETLWAVQRPFKLKPHNFISPPLLLFLFFFFSLLLLLVITVVTACYYCLFTIYSFNWLSLCIFYIVCVYIE